MKDLINLTLTDISYRNLDYPISVYVGRKKEADISVKHNYSIKPQCL